MLPADTNMMTNELLEKLGRLMQHNNMMTAPKMAKQ